MSVERFIVKLPGFVFPKPFKIIEFCIKVEKEFMVQGIMVLVELEMVLFEDLNEVFSFRNTNEITFRVYRAVRIK